MALSLTDIMTLAEDDVLKKRVHAAMVIAAEGIRSEADTTVNHAARLVWAKQVLQDNDPSLLLAKGMLRALLAKFQPTPSVTLQNVPATDDPTIINVVAAEVNVFAQ